ncbi:MAG: hypothetical protein ACW976_01390, partial [Candidatus Ranarchaeia archaeon]|jgi:tetratricopeptide (TPR) repeat protein
MDYLATLEFLAGICSLDYGKYKDTITYFSNGSLSSLISGSDDQALHLRFLSAIVSMLAKEYQASSEFFRKASRLAEQIKNTDIKLKADVGEAISLFLSDRKNIAQKALEITRRDSKEDPATTASILNEFGDQLFNLGLCNIAQHLYGQSLENAIQAKTLTWVREGLADLTRCYFSNGGSLTTLKQKYHEGIKLSKTLNRKTQTAILGTMEKTLEEMESPPEQEFPMGRTVSFDELPSVFKGWMDVSYFEVQKRRTIFVCYLPGTGNVGLSYPEKDIKIKIPESTRVKILPHSKIRFSLVNIPLKKKIPVRLFLELNQEGTLDTHSTFYENFATRLLS